MKTFLKTLLACLFVMVLSDLKAQILGWNFSIPATQGNEEHIPAIVKDPNLKESLLHRGDGLLGTSKLPRSFMAKIPFTGRENIKEKAFSSKVYFEFNITPKRRNAVDLTSLKCKMRPGAGGPFLYRWAYSLDGGKRYTEIGLKDIQIKYDPSKPDGFHQEPIDLSSIKDLQNVTKSVSFRVYIWGARNPKTSTFAIGKSEAGNNNDYVLTVDGIVKGI